VVPEDVGRGLEISRSARIALPALVDLIVADAAAMGFRFAPVPGPAPLRAASAEAR
jgi:hypothetical protein